MLAALFLSRQHSDAETLVFVGAFLFGAFAMPLYSLAAAHANDRAGSGQYVLISAGLTFFFSLGAVVGPYTASLVIQHFGPPAFFVYTCAVHGFLALVVMIRIKSRASVPVEQRSRFVSLLRTSPVFFRMARRISRDRPTSDQSSNQGQNKETKDGR
jgi:MFS family permease